MKTAIEALLRQSLDALPDELVPREARLLDIEVQNSRDSSRGDFASNLALRLARTAGAHPRQLADALVSALPANDSVARVEIAGAGFINFFLTDEAYHAQIRCALAEGEAYGRSRRGAGRLVQVEFVCADPTGPLHVNHGRHAAFSAAVANLLEATGFAVQRKFHINDAGRQTQLLALSTWLRYLQLCGETLRFPAAGHRGEFLVDIAGQLRAREGAALQVDAGALFRDLPPDRAEGGDADVHIDALVARARSLIGEQSYHRVLELALEGMRVCMHADLQAFGVDFDRGSPGRSLTGDGTVDTATGTRTALYVLGADQQGYLPRLRAVLDAPQDPPACQDVRLVQSVALRGADKVPMSTRPGEMLTLRELRREVGNDAARLFYVMRSNDQPLDFDLQLARSRTHDNPVYDIQYAHALVASVFKQLATRGVPHDRERGLRSIARLTEPQEAALARRIAAFPALLAQCAQNRAPHTLVHYLRDLAHGFHTYHGEHPLLVEDPVVRDARLVLATATQTVIRNGLKLLGVSAPVTM